MAGRPGTVRAVEVENDEYKAGMLSATLGE